MEQDNSSSLTEPEEVFTPVPSTKEGASQGQPSVLGIGWDLGSKSAFHVGRRCNYLLSC